MAISLKRALYHIRLYIAGQFYNPMSVPRSSTGWQLTRRPPLCALPALTCHAAQGAQASLQVAQQVVVVGLVCAHRTAVSRSRPTKRWRGRPALLRSFACPPALSTLRR
eukprot:COSAG03_NODE_592_length_6822_cov_29.000000_3_plen_109_part_00